MLTLDQLLIHLIDASRIDTVPLKDKKILVSLRQQLKRQYFFTEKQGNLLVKLLQNNKRKILNLTVEEDAVINSPCWGQDFRIVLPIKKIYFNNESMSEIVVECVNEKEIKQKLTSEFTASGQREIISSTSSHIRLRANEHNLVKLIQLLENDNFDIDSDVLEVYQKIKELMNSSNNLLDIFHERNKKILELLSSECNSSMDKNLYFLDRQIRHQYTFSCEQKSTLPYKIANRSNTNVWIDETTFTLNEVLEAVKELNRFPILFVYDIHSVESCHSLTVNLNEALDHIEIEKSVGIYFRFDNNNEENKKFNQLISDLKFNSYLDEHTKIVGIEYKNLPKFLLKTNWYPKTVITNVPNFQRTKSYRYCDQVDLIISYSPNKPLLEGDYYAIV